VTGITGFIGSELARKLVEQRHEVFGFVRHVIGRDFKSIDDIKDEIAILTCDIADYTSVRNAIKKVGPDIALHLAAISPVRLSFEHPFCYHQCNFIGTVNVAESLMELYGPDKVRLVVASTAEVYGIQDEKPFTEDITLAPSSPYAVSKAAMDMYVRMLFTIHNFNGVILRNSNTFGRKYDTSFFTEYLISTMLAGHDVYVGAPDSVRDYIYVSDHVNAYILAMTTPRARGDVFNIAGGVGYTNREWASKIAEVCNFDTKRIIFGQYPPEYPYRPLASDQPYLVLDSSRARKILGWEQTVSPQEGLKKTVEYWKSVIESV
jgi:nucleoside-diphosphate-sugar epimerase